MIGTIMADIVPLTPNRTVRHNYPEPTVRPAQLRAWLNVLRHFRSVCLALPRSASSRGRGRAGTIAIHRRISRGHRFLDALSVSVRCETRAGAPPASEGGTSAQYSRRRTSSLWPTLL